MKIEMDDEQLKPLPMDWKNNTKKKGTHGFSGLMRDTEATIRTLPFIQVLTIKFKEKFPIESYTL